MPRPLCPVCQTAIYRGSHFCHRHAGLRTPQARAAASRRREVATLVALLGSHAAAAQRLGISRSRVTQIMQREKELDGRP